MLVIPYQAGWGSQRIPINQFFRPAMPPPPPPLAPQQSERVQPTGVEIEDNDNAIDDDWLMDG
ncbi:putative conserved secreted protein [Synechococcus sp. RS9915]|nr:putative conserved secreted protein [Synechococcus sp. RS9915]